jgi:hypothetical protein
MRVGASHTAIPLLPRPSRAESGSAPEILPAARAVMAPVRPAPGSSTFLAQLIGQETLGPGVYLSPARARAAAYAPPAPRPAVSVAA